MMTAVDDSGSADNTAWGARAAACPSIGTLPVPIFRMAGSAALAAAMELELAVSELRAGSPRAGDATAAAAGARQLVGGLLERAPDAGGSNVAPAGADDGSVRPSRRLPRPRPRPSRGAATAGAASAETSASLLRCRSPRPSRPSRLPPRPRPVRPPSRVADASAAREAEDASSEAGSVSDGATGVRSSTDFFGFAHALTAGFDAETAIADSVARRRAWVSGGGAEGEGRRGEEGGGWRGVGGAKEGVAEREDDRGAAPQRASRARVCGRRGEARRGMGVRGRREGGVGDCARVACARPAGGASHRALLNR